MKWQELTEINCCHLMPCSYHNQTIENHPSKVLILHYDCQILLVMVTVKVASQSNLIKCANLTNLTCQIISEKSQLLSENVKFLAASIPRVTLLSYESLVSLYENMSCQAESSHYLSRELNRYNAVCNGYYNADHEVDTMQTSCNLQCSRL